MAETVNGQENVTDNDANAENQGRTFTQEEVNNIVADRLKRESAKYSDYQTLADKAKKFDELEETNKTELEKATEKANSLQAELDKLNKANEIRDIRDKVSQETGVPASLLLGDTEELCKQQATAILNFKNSQEGYPSVKDGGEIQSGQKKSVESQFADWFSASMK